MLRPDMSPPSTKHELNFLEFAHKIILQMKMKVVELVILNTSTLLNQHGQLFELCSQTPTIDFKSMSGGSETLF